MQKSHGALETRPANLEKPPHGVPTREMLVYVQEGPPARTKGLRVKPRRSGLESTRSQPCSP